VNTERMSILLGLDVIYNSKMNDHSFIVDLHNIAEVIEVLQM